MMKQAARSDALKLFGGRQAPGDYWGGMAAMLAALLSIDTLKTCDRKEGSDD